MTKLDTSSFGEFGVQGQYLDREGYFVDDSLARRLHFRPQFQITWFIVQTISVFVMDVFNFLQWATEYFFHQYSMLVRLESAAKMQASISRRMNVAFFIDWAPRASFPAALFRAEFLLHVVAGVAAVFCAAQLALSDFAAQLALESRRWLAVHKHWLSGMPVLVKEIV